MHKISFNTYEQVSYQKLIRIFTNDFLGMPKYNIVILYTKFLGLPKYNTVIQYTNFFRYS